MKVIYGQNVRVKNCNIFDKKIFFLNYKIYYNLFIIKIISNKDKGMGTIKHESHEDGDHQKIVLFYYIHIYIFVDKTI